MAAGLVLMSGSTQSMGIAEFGVGLEVNHMWWYRLRVIVARIKCMVCLWVDVYRIIFHDRRGLLRIGSDRNMWVTRVSMDSWCCVDSTGKVSVVPRSGIWVVVRIISCCFGLVDMSWILGKLVVIVRLCLDTSLRLWFRSHRCVEQVGTPYMDWEISEWFTASLWWP